jgi:phosphohistidine phosphatase SixA
MTKTLYCIRHGRALHNIYFNKIGEEAYRKFMDSPLMNEGVEEARKLKKSWSELNKIDLVLTSPLSRTLATTDIIFRNTHIPIIALDELLEYPQSYHRCNMRCAIGDLCKIYQRVNFDNINSNIDFEFLDEKREEKDEIKYLEERITNLKEWIGCRKEKNIAIVGHSSYFNYMINGIVDNEKNGLKHCHPYKITV